jgi:hypothetical protein
MTRHGSSQALIASAKLTPCFCWFSRSLGESHSKLALQGTAYMQNVNIQERPSRQMLGALVLSTSISNPLPRQTRRCPCSSMSRSSKTIRMMSAAPVLAFSPFGAVEGNKYPKQEGGYKEAVAFLFWIVKSA